MLDLLSKKTKTGRPEVPHVNEDERHRAGQKELDAWIAKYDQRYAEYRDLDAGVMRGGHPADSDPLRREAQALLAGMPSGSLKTLQESRDAAYREKEVLDRAVAQQREELGRVVDQISAEVLESQAVERHIQAQMRAMRQGIRMFVDAARELRDFKVYLVRQGYTVHRLNVVDVWGWFGPGTTSGDLLTERQGRIDLFLQQLEQYGVTD